MKRNSKTVISRKTKGDLDSLVSTGSITVHTILIAQESVNVTRLIREEKK